MPLGKLMSFGKNRDSGRETGAAEAASDVVARAVSNWPADVSRILDADRIVEPLETSPAIKLQSPLAQNCYVVRSRTIDIAAPLRVALRKKVRDVVLVLQRFDRNTQINLNGSDSVFWLGRGKRLSVIVALGGGSSVVIGDDTTAQGLRIVTEKSHVSVGRDVMISSDVTIHSAEQHGIVDLTDDGPVLQQNQAQRSVIQPHVWLGIRTLVIGNVTIGAGSIVGAGSVVVKDIPQNVMAAGNPASVKRENVTWSRRAHEIDAASQDYIAAIGSSAGDEADVDVPWAEGET